MDEMFDMTFPPVRYRFPRYLASQGQGKQVEQQRQQWARSQDDSKLQIARLDVSHYKPEEVTCKVENGKVLVSGKHYSENEYGYDATEFHRKYCLPEGVDPQSVKLRISRDGVLQIEAAKEQLKPVDIEEMGIDETDDDKISLKINLGGYKPEEVNVRVKGNELLVTAEHLSEGEGHSTHRQFKRQFSLPKGVDASTLVSRFSKDGTLSIEAQKKEIPAIEEKHIDVQQDEKIQGEDN